MISELAGLYQELILDHGKRPRNHRVVENANCVSEGYNPLCGDRVTIYVKLDDDVISDVGFQGSGCAISTASASMMTERLKGKRRAEAEALFEDFHNLVTGKKSGNGGAEELGKLTAFSGVSEFPARVKCATLSWHTLIAALKGKKEPVSTE